MTDRVSRGTSTVSRRGLLAGLGAGGLVLAGVGTGTARADAGDEVWRVDVGDFTPTPPAVGEGLVVVGSDAFHAFDEDGDELWEHDSPTHDVPVDPHIDDGTVYVAGHESGMSGEGYGLYALDDDGEVTWEGDWEETEEFIPEPDGFGSGIASDEDHVYITGGTFLYALDRDTGEALWSFNNGAFQQGTNWGTPTVVDDLVIAGHNGGDVHAVDRITGEEVWTYDGGNNRFSSAVIRDGVAYIGTRDPEIIGLAVDAEGEVVWEHTIEDDSSAGGLAIVDGSLVFGTGNGTVYSVDVDADDPDEQVEWSASTGGSPGAPAVGQERLYVGADESIHALKRDDGEDAWQSSVGSEVRGTAVSGSTLYVTDSEGGLSALDLGDDAAAGEETDDDDGLPGFGAPAALLGLGGAAYLLRDRFTGE